MPQLTRNYFLRLWGRWRIPLNISHCSFHEERSEENCWFLWGCGAVLCNRWVQIALSNEQNHLRSSCSRVRSLHTGKKNSQQQPCWRIPRDADKNWRMAWNWFRMANGKHIFRSDIPFGNFRLPFKTFRLFCTFRFQEINPSLSSFLRFKTIIPK